MANVKVVGDVPIIHRGALNKNTFKFPFRGNEVAALFITYQQMGSTVAEKSLSDVVFGNNIVTCWLSQEDTIKMLPRQKLAIQIRGRLTDDTPIVSNIVQAKTDGDLLKEGVV